MLQRAAAAAVLIYGAVTNFHATSQVTSAGLQIMDAGTAILLLIGLWTPVVGAVIACRELWIVLSGGDDPGLAFVLATFGATLAMIGPGAWSVDARLFGRKQIKILH